MSKGRLKDLARSVCRPVLDYGIKRPVVTAFHYLYYKSPESWMKNTFLGFPIYQCPLDLQLYQELIFKIQPRYILQTGICDGGSLLYFACMLDAVKADVAAKVIGIDLALTEKAATLHHPRIEMLVGDSVAPETVERVRATLPDVGPGIVILDSDHSCNHVFRELAIYSEFTTIDSYMVVEDTNVNGRPVAWRHGPGPYEAVSRFLQNDRRFVRDEALWERNLFSHHKHGWLKRIG